MWFGPRSLECAGSEMELPTWRLRCWFADQDFHTNSGVGHDSQKIEDPMPGQHSLDAEVGGCAIRIGNLNQWVNKSVNGQ